MLALACQLDIAWHDKSANHDRLRQLVSAAQPPPGSLIVAPEMFATGFSMQVAEVAETSSGPTHAFLAELASATRCHVLAGVVTLDAQARGRNEAALFDPDGKEVARYAKRHPFSLGGETKNFVAGGAIVTHQVGPFLLAPTICYDLRFPETYRQATLRGANLLVVIANWPEARIAHWRALLVARAIENQAYVVGVNRVGADPSLRYTGQSLIVDPLGRLLADAGDGQRTVAADLELEPLEAYRRYLPALADIRPDDAAGLDAR
jgi:predicted amidohydrolase